MLGHTGCGAIKAAIEGHSGGFIDYILKDIAAAIGDEKDEYKATCLNVEHGVQRIRDELKIHPSDEDKGVEVVVAIYDIEDGTVTFM